MKLRTAKCLTGPENECIVRSARLLGMLLFGLSIICAPTSLVHGAVGPNWIEQWGIQWTFDKPLSLTDGAGTYQYGQFVNGDYWVVGPVNIINISPEWDGQKNGSMINPVLQAAQGYHVNADSYTAGLNVAIGISENTPLELAPNDSLMSTIGSTTKGPDNLGRTWLIAAAVLTVLDAPVSDTTFRPPYVGTNKPLYDSANLRTDLLPSISYIDGGFYTPGYYRDPAPGGTEVERHARYYERPHIFHKHFHVGEDIRPYQNADTYYRNAHNMDSESALLLLTDLADTEQLLINYVQTGIDAYYTIQTNPNPTARGERCLSKWMILFSGLMLDDINMQSNHNYNDPAYGLSYFKEDFATYFGNESFVNPGGTVNLWTGWQHSGHPYAANVLYRHALAGDDPALVEYEHLGWTVESPPDNSFEGYRRCCNTMGWVGAALAARIMNAESIWDHDAFFAYIDRWMYENDSEWYSGGVSQGEVYGSTFTLNMWTTYRANADSLTKPIITPSGGTYTSSVTVTLSGGGIGADIRYTLDGGDPTESSTLYTQALVLTGSTTLKTRAFKTGEDPSSVSSAEFTIVQDTTPPIISSVSVVQNPTQLAVSFNEQVEQITAQNKSNYSISPYVAIDSATLSSDQKTVMLNTGTFSAGVTYTLTVNNVKDISDNTILANTQESFEFIPITLESGLVGFWEFEEGSGLTTADSSDKNNNGTLVNDQMWTGDGALDLNGSGEYVNCGAGPDLNITGSLTISAKITPQSFGQGGYGRIVDKTDGSTGFSFFLNESGNGLGYLEYAGALAWSDAAAVSVGQQQYVAVVYNTSLNTVTFYVDGQPVGSSNYQTNPIDSSSNPLYIGIRGYDMNRDFDGLIDNVRVYNRTLSADEILELYNEEASTPANNPPTAGNDIVRVNEDIGSGANTIDVLANDTDADGDTLTITSITQASHASVAIAGGGTSLTYTPTPNYNGSDSFTYTISDGQGGIDTATVSVTVNNIPDAPVLGTIGDKTVNENQTLTIVINATDADGDTITYSAQQLPPGATFASPFVWTPTYDDEGTYEVIFVASDGSLSDSETITITVNNVNRPPVAVADSAVTNEDTTVTTGNVLTNDTDGDGDTITVANFNQASHGTVAYNGDGTFTYTPAANYNGDDSFTYTLSDGNGGTDIATVHLDITAINDSPDVSAIPDVLQKYENESILPAEIELATDIDSGDTLTYTYIPDLQAADYILHVDVSDGTVTVGKDITITVISVPPEVVSVTATKFTVEVVFSEDLEQVSAENIDNYSLSNGITINSLLLNAGLDEVTLYTTGHAEDLPYTLTVANVKDLAENTMIGETIDYTFDDGLIGLWRFNDKAGNTAQDSSGYGNTATLVNGPVWSEQSDLNFDGIDDAVAIPTADWNVNSGTVALWAYAQDLAGIRNLFGHTTGSGNDSIGLYTDEGNLNLEFGDSGLVSENIENLDLQTWYHFTLTWDGTNYFLYVNGGEEAWGTFSGLTDLNTFADIGNTGQISYRDSAFDGHIDDARVYKRALSPDEVINVYLMSDESIRESKALAFVVSATYPDGSTLIYSKTDPNLLVIDDGVLDGASFNEKGTDTFAWNPWYDQAGSHDITFLPDDQQKPQYSQTVTVVVEDVQLSDWYQTWLEHLGLL